MVSIANRQLTLTPPTTTPAGHNITQEPSLPLGNEPGGGRPDVSRLLPHRNTDNERPTCVFVPESSNFSKVGNLFSSFTQKRRMVARLDTKTGHFTEDKKDFPEKPKLSGFAHCDAGHAATLLRPDCEGRSGRNAQFEATLTLRTRAAWAWPHKELPFLSWFKLGCG